MSKSFANDLAKAGIAFDGYLELAQPIQQGSIGRRWPLIAATDQVLLALRWKRDALSADSGVSKVRELPTRGAGSGPAASDWFLEPEAPPTSIVSKPRAV
jgi:hypothetical protein